MTHVASVGLATVLLLVQFTRPVKIDLVPYAALIAAADAWLSQLGA